MLLRMRKQTLRKEIGSDKLWVPGPGNYPHGRLSDVGNDRRKLQTWKTPLRNPNWFLLKTDAPTGEKVLGGCFLRDRMRLSFAGAERSTWRVLTPLCPPKQLFSCSPVHNPSRNRCGGYLSTCWPQMEDEQGRSLALSERKPHSPLSRKKGVATA